MSLRALVAMPGTPLMSTLSRWREHINHLIRPHAEFSTRRRVEPDAVVFRIEHAHVSLTS